MSNNFGAMMLSKAIDVESLSELHKNGVSERTFVNKGDKDVYRFLIEYAEHNRGQVPSYATIVDKFGDRFTYVPGVIDSFEYLAKEVKNRKAQFEFKDFVDSLQSNFDSGKNNMQNLIDSLTDELQMINNNNRHEQTFGTNLKHDVGRFKSEYMKRKIGGSVKVWNSSFSYINEEVGGWSSGSVYVFYARSGRGKSVITTYDAVHLAREGANVLLWTLEMSAYEVMTRMFTFMSALEGKTLYTDDETLEEYESGYSADLIRNGSLSDDMETDFMNMLDELNSSMKGNIFIRSVDDEDFYERNLRQLESDIESVNADVVVIDPFYYLDYEANKSKTAGGDAAETSKKLRRLAGQKDVVVFAITQAEEDDKEQDKDEIRALKLPKRREVKKTKSLLEDASVLIALDTDYRQKAGVIGINKGRNGGEGTTKEFVYIPNVGIVKEMNINGDMFGDF
ncbi:DnaB-like helicase C-terminal domain-containing protein [Staphylococcus felis]|uniref:AAA family ATPase n=1 Tax=Staphylococcus felis TaxID=46127 RepID=A0ABS0QLJ3_9STAP|nr:DnaB-like helicase C-terminal domain-containing protein [Staphylococcus felis]MBH9580078.1 AAA family ATPase [Staphylococcus felis]REI09491.1 DNA helicase [Staphylococcus felis]REI33633.1 DNA helicase [Staphylococcus felis]